MSKQKAFYREEPHLLESWTELKKSYQSPGLLQGVLEENFIKIVFIWKGMPRHFKGRNISISLKCLYAEMPTAL